MESQLKKKYDLFGTEIHTAWMLRPYLEQRKISNFETLDYKARRSAVMSTRKRELLRLQKSNQKLYKQIKKNYRHTEPYCHLSYDERKDILIKLSKMVSKWDFSRLFAECVDKIFFDPSIAPSPVEEQAFEQVVSRFEQYLQITSAGMITKNMGMLIHDNNPTVANNLTLPS